MSQKKQHYVPRCYLKSWCDPNAPTRHNPYVWLHSLDGQRIRKKAPENIFTETDFYTIKRPDGSPDLVLEKGLSGLESEFASLYRHRIRKHQPLSDYDRFILCAFTAAMQARTKGQRDHWRESWQQALDLMDRVQERLSSISPEERARALPPGHRAPGEDETNEFSYEDVQALIEQPMELLVSTLRVVTPILFTMQMTILETSAVQGFITSDAPCCWFDPEIIRGNSPFRSPGLASPTIEISLPLSPTQLVYFTHHRVKTNALYFPIGGDTSLVEGFNQRSGMYAREYAISNRSLPIFSQKSQ